MRHEKDSGSENEKLKTSKDVREESEKKRCNTFLNNFFFLLFFSIIFSCNPLFVLS